MGGIIQEKTSLEVESDEVGQLPGPDLPGMK
jgi:hypothetical protein